MFDIGWSELLLIGVVALIAIGPKELPGALRTLGQWMGKVRRMAGEFQNQFQEAIREAELSDLKKEVDDMAAKATSYTHFDPLDDVRREIESAVGPVQPLDPNRPELSDSSAVSVPSTSSEAPAGPPAEAAPAPGPSEAAPELPAPVTQAPVEPVPSPSAGEHETVGASAPKPDAGKAP